VPLDIPCKVISSNSNFQMSTLKDNDPRRLSAVDVSDEIRHVHDDLKREAFEVMSPSASVVPISTGSVPVTLHQRESSDGSVDAILVNRARTDSSGGATNVGILDARKPSASVADGEPTSPSNKMRISGDSGTGSRGGSGGSADKDSSGSEKRNQIKVLRYKAWIFLIVSEVVLGLLAMGQILSFQSFVLDAATTNARTELRFLNLQFEDTFLRHILGMQTLSHLSQTEFLLQSGLQANPNITTQFQVLLGEQAVTRRLHFLTLVNTDGTILMGANNNRSGEYWNPAGVITTLENTGAPYVMTTSVLSLSELNQEHPPEYFDGALSYKAKQHMRRAGTDGLVQYIAVPVKSNGTLVGYFIGGHIISGDTILLENSVSLFGSGFGAVLFPSNNGTPTEAMQLLIKGGLNYFEDDLSTSAKQDIINKAFSDSGVHTSYVTIRDVNHVIAYQRTPNTQIGSANYTADQTPAICIVGHPLDAVNNVFQEVISITLAFVTACLIVDVIGTMVSIRLFIDPLERLQQYVKLKVYKKYEALLKEISLNQRYMLRVVIFSLLSVVFLILMITYNTKSLTKVFQLESQASVELKLLEYSYTLGPVRNSLGQSVLVDDDLFQNYLDNSGDSSLYSQVVSELVSEMNSRKLEYATLVGSDSRILAGANANRTGQYFDPSGVVSDVLSNARRLVVTTEMTNAEFRMEGAKRWLKPYAQTSLEGVLQSKLHPYANNNTVLVRWSASPVFATSNTNKSRPDGVLLYGDIINGKISFNELIVSEFDDGYAATFLYNSTTGQFVLLSSVRQTDGGLVIDEQIPETVQALKGAISSRSLSVVEGTYAGEPFEMAGDAFETSTFYACTNEQVPLLDAAYNPPLYQVRSTSNAHWLSLRKRQLAIQVITVLVQVISSALISWVLFLPVYRFVQVMQQEFGVNKANKYKSESKGAGFKGVLSKFGVNSLATRNSQAKESEAGLSSVA
jgi:hypothetical protein